MKGMALAIETIIYIILAVTVLSVLLLWFLGTGGPSQTQMQLEASRNIYCGNYVQNDVKCESDGSKITGLETNKFKEVCSKLKVNGCSTASKECFQACCSLFCPKQKTT